LNVFLFETGISPQGASGRKSAISTST